MRNSKIYFIFIILPLIHISSISLELFEVLLFENDCFIVAGHAEKFCSFHLLFNILCFWLLYGGSIDIIIKEKRERGRNSWVRKKKEEQEQVKRH